MPTAMAKMLDILAIPAGERDFTALDAGKRIAAGVQLPAPSPVFPRYVEPEVAA
jgi:methionyl-tRNA synthetase